MLTQEREPTLRFVSKWVFDASMKCEDLCSARHCQPRQCEGLQLQSRSVLKDSWTFAVSVEIPCKIVPRKSTCFTREAITVLFNTNCGNYQQKAQNASCKSQGNRLCQNRKLFRYLLRTKFHCICAIIDDIHTTCNKLNKIISYRWGLKLDTKTWLKLLPKSLPRTKEPWNSVWKLELLHLCAGNRYGWIPWECRKPDLQQEEWRARHSVWGSDQRWGSYCPLNSYFIQVFIEIITNQKYIL